MEDKLKKLKLVEYSGSKVVYKYCHNSKQKVFLEEFDNKGDRFWRLKIDGLTVGYWNQESTSVGELIEYIDSLIVTTSQIKEELISRYDNVIKEAKENGSVRFIDKEFEKIVEINKNSDLFIVSVNGMDNIVDTLSSERLFSVIRDSGDNQLELFKQIAEWLEKYLPDSSDYYMDIGKYGEPRIKFVDLMNKHYKKLGEFDIYQLSHLIDGLNQTKDLTLPEYFAPKVFKILRGLGVINAVCNLERIKRSTVDSVLNRALNRDNTKGV